MPRDFDQPTSSSASCSTDTGSREQSQQPSAVRSRQGRFEAHGPTPSAEEPNQAQSILARHKTIKPPPLTISQQLGEPQLPPAGQRSPAYLQGKNPYGQLLERIEHPYREPKAAAKSEGPPSQTGSSIEGRPRTSGPLEFKTRPTPPEPKPEQRVPTPDPQPPPLAPGQPPKPSSVRATKDFFETRASQISSPPPLPPSGTAAALRGTAPKRQPLGPSLDSSTHIHSPNHARSPEKDESGTALPPPHLLSESEHIELSQRVDPAPRIEADQPAPNVVVRKATPPTAVPLPKDNNSETEVERDVTGSRKSTNIFVNPPRDAKPLGFERSAVESSSALDATSNAPLIALEESKQAKERETSQGAVRRPPIRRSVSADETKEAETSILPKPQQEVRRPKSNQYLRKAFEEDNEPGPRPLRPLTEGAPSDDRAASRESSKPSATALETTRNKFGTPVNVRKRVQDIAARGLSHDGSFDAQDDAQDYAQDDDYDIEVPDDVDTRSAYGRRQTGDFGFPGAHTKADGAYHTNKPLGDPGKWIKRTCGHFSYMSKGESREQAHKKECRQCSVMTSSPPQSSSQQLALPLSSTSTFSKKTEDFGGRKVRHRQHHWDCIPHDKCGYAFAEDLGHFIDSILEEHANVLQDVIDNIKHRGPHQSADVPLTAAERLNVGKTGQLKPNMNDSLRNLRESVKSVPELLDLVNSAADDLGLDLDRLPTAKDEERFRNAPFEGTSSASVFPHREDVEAKIAEWRLQQTRKHLAELSKARTQAMGELDSIAEELGVQLQGRSVSEPMIDSIQRGLEEGPTSISGEYTRPRSNSAGSVAEDIPRMLQQSSSDPWVDRSPAHVSKQSLRSLAITRSLQEVKKIPSVEPKESLEVVQTQLPASGFDSADVPEDQLEFEQQHEGLQHGQRYGSQYEQLDEPDPESDAEVEPELYEDHVKSPPHRTHVEHIIERQGQIVESRRRPIEKRKKAVSLSYEDDDSITHAERAAGSQSVDSAPLVQGMTDQHPKEETEQRDMDRVAPIRTMVSPSVKSAASLQTESKQTSSSESYDDEQASDSDSDSEPGLVPEPEEPSIAGRVVTRRRSSLASRQRRMQAERTSSPVFPVGSESAENLSQLQQRFAETELDLSSLQPTGQKVPAASSLAQRAQRTSSPTPSTLYEPETARLISTGESTRPSNKPNRKELERGSLLPQPEQIDETPSFIEVEVAESQIPMERTVRATAARKAERRHKSTNPSASAFPVSQPVVEHFSTATQPPPPTPEHELEEPELEVHKPSQEPVLRSTKGRRSRVRTTSSEPVAGMTTTRRPAEQTLSPVSATQRATTHGLNEGTPSSDHVPKKTKIRRPKEMNSSHEQDGRTRRPKKRPSSAEPAIEEVLEVQPAELITSPKGIVVRVTTHTYTESLEGPLAPPSPPSSEEELVVPSTKPLLRDMSKVEQEEEERNIRSVSRVSDMPSSQEIIAPKALRHRTVAMSRQPTLRRHLTRSESTRLPGVSSLTSPETFSSQGIERNVAQSSPLALSRPTATSEAEEQDLVLEETAEHQRSTLEPPSTLSGRTTTASEQPIPGQRQARVAQRTGISSKRSKVMSDPTAEHAEPSTILTGQLPALTGISKQGVLRQPTREPTVPEVLFLAPSQQTTGLSSDPNSRESFPYEMPALIQNDVVDDSEDEESDIEQSTSRLMDQELLQLPLLPSGPPSRRISNLPPSSREISGHEMPILIQRNVDEPAEEEELIVERRSTHQPAEPERAPLPASKEATRRISDSESTRSSESDMTEPVQPDFEYVTGEEEHVIKRQLARQQTELGLASIPPSEHNDRLVSDPRQSSGYDIPGIIQRSAEYLPEGDESFAERHRARQPATTTRKPRKVLAERHGTSEVSGHQAARQAVGAPEEESAENVESRQTTARRPIELERRMTTKEGQTTLPSETAPEHVSQAPKKQGATRVTNDPTLQSRQPTHQSPVPSRRSKLRGQTPLPGTEDLPAEEPPAPVVTTVTRKPTRFSQRSTASETTALLPTPSKKPSASSRRHNKREDTPISFTTVGGVVSGDTEPAVKAEPHVEDYPAHEVPAADEAPIDSFTPEELAAPLQKANTASRKPKRILAEPHSPANDETVSDVQRHSAHLTRQPTRLAAAQMPIPIQRDVEAESESEPTQETDAEQDSEPSSVLDEPLAAYDVYHAFPTTSKTPSAGKTSRKSERALTGGQSIARDQEEPTDAYMVSRSPTRPSQQSTIAAPGLQATGPREADERSPQPSVDFNVTQRRAERQPIIQTESTIEGKKTGRVERAPAVARSRNPKTSVPPLGPQTAEAPAEEASQLEQRRTHASPEMDERVPRILTAPREQDRRRSNAAPEIVAPPPETVQRDFGSTSRHTAPAKKAKRVANYPPDHQYPPAPAYPLRETPAWTKPDKQTPASKPKVEEPSKTRGVPASMAKRRDDPPRRQATIYAHKNDYYPRLMPIDSEGREEYPLAGSASERTDVALPDAASTRRDSLTTRPAPLDDVQAQARSSPEVLYHERLHPFCHYCRHFKPVVHDHALAGQASSSRSKKEEAERARRSSRRHEEEEEEVVPGPLQIYGESDTVESDGPAAHPASPGSDAEARSEDGVWDQDAVFASQDDGDGSSGDGADETADVEGEH